ncbi:MAG: hypothetical protein IPL50_03495 [Chitinophagaceae bacterium]|nr:hypothetical protein [Chitinophagaceae bacterium]
MKIFILLLMMPICCFAQQYPEIKPNENLEYRAKIIADSGTVKGYLVAHTDSMFILSSTKRYMANTGMHIPVNTIQELQIRNKTGVNLLGITCVTVFGFIVTAGLTNNAGDVDNDGRTSFLELVFAAIEGSTSGKQAPQEQGFDRWRSRRNRFYGYWLSGFQKTFDQFSAE